jgi:hypothetical protein
MTSLITHSSRVSVVWIGWISDIVHDPHSERIRVSLTRFGPVFYIRWAVPKLIV